MIPDGIIERARDRDLREVAEQLGAQLRRLGGEWVGPCLVCGGDDRFSVNPRKGLWNCRHCGKGGDAVALVMHIAGCSFREAVVQLTGEAWVATAPRKAPVVKDDAYERRQHEKARSLWGQRELLAGTVAERYLRLARGYGGRLPPSLGFLQPSRPEHHPALIAAFTVPRDHLVDPDALLPPVGVEAVHLTFLSPDGSWKAPVDPDKIAVGAHKGLPLALAPVNDGLGLAICEGIEDALTVHEDTGLGAWAAGGHTFMPALADAVPAYVEAVTVFADPEPEAQRNARALRDALVELGHETLLIGGQHER